jgi:hypothetical protein
VCEPGLYRRPVEDDEGRKAAAMAEVHPDQREESIFVRVVRQAYTLLYGKL